MAKKHLDFDLRIWRSPEGYGASTSSPGQGGVGPVNLSPPFREGELEALLAPGGGLRRDVAAAAGSETPQQVRDLGRRLFSAVFHAGIQAFWATCRERARQSGRAVRLRLILQDPELWSWPWELLADPDGDLLIASPKVSIVRSPEVPRPVPAHRVKPPVRVLIAVADPRGTQRLGSSRELEALRSLVAAGKRRRRWKLALLEHATLAELQQVLGNGKPFHILHFIGHGKLDRETGEGVVLFESKDGRQEPVPGEEFARIVKDHSSIALVVLNACEGGRAPREEPFAGAALSLIRGGIPAVIAMQFKVADEAAIVFSRALYENLAKGASLDEAVYAGRRALLAERFGFESANPVLYMRGTEGRIFRVTPPWIRRLAAAVGTFLILALGYVFRNPVRVWLAPAPPAVASDPGCPSPPGLDMPFARISPGRLSMGSARGPREERPAHEVEITRPYCIGRFEVTQRQWRRVMGENPSRHHGDFRPVEGISWTDAQQFLGRLNQLDPAGRYRLPTEAEWELAAVSGGGSPDAEKVSRYGNCLGRLDGFSETARVGVFAPNSRGLFDLYGNVSEWVSDWYGPYPAGEVTDPTGPVSGTEKVRRGGSFINSAENCMATHRARSKPDRRAGDTGFRVAREAAPLL